MLGAFPAADQRRLRLMSSAKRPTPLSIASLEAAMLRALGDKGVDARPVWCYSLRDGAALELLRGCDVVITTVLAAANVKKVGTTAAPSTTGSACST